MRKQDVIAGGIYLTRSSRYSHMPDAYLILSADPLLSVQRSLRSVSTVFRRSPVSTQASGKGASAFAALEIIDRDTMKRLDAWAEGGEPPAIVREAGEVTGLFTRWAEKNVVAGSEPIEYPSTMIPPGTVLRSVNARNLVGPWLTARRDELIEHAESAKRRTEAAQERWQREGLFERTRALGGELGVTVLSNFDDFRSVKIEIEAVAGLLAEVKAYRALSENGDDSAA